MAHWSGKLDEIRRIHSEEIKEQNAIALSFNTPNKSSTPTGTESMEVIDSEVTTSAPQMSEDSIWEVNSEELPILTEDQLPESKSRRVEELKRDISVMETERNSLKESVNLSSIEQFNEKLSAYRFLFAHFSRIIFLLKLNYRDRLQELEAVTSTRDDARKKFDECRK